jgi:hypothetical protein
MAKFWNPTSVTRPQGSDMIFDHPYNADSMRPLPVATRP